MKIGYDAKRLFANFTGLGNYSRTLVKNFAKYETTAEISLFTKRGAGSQPELQEFLTERYEIVQPSGFSPLWRQRGVCKDIKASGVELYHGLSHELPIGIQKCGVPSVVTMHDVCYRTFPRMFSATERAIYGVKYRNACKYSDKIIAISQSTKDDVLKYFDVEPEKVEVLYQAINPQFYGSIKPHRAQKIVQQYGVMGDFMLYVGSINSRKNLLGIIKAFASLDRGHRVPLVVIGRGREYKERCMREAVRLKVQSEIKIIENVHSMETLQAFYSQAQLMVYPSFYEGFGLPVTEAILSGCPVITSNVSSLPEAGGSAALYVEPSSVEQIASAMIKILDMNPLQRAALSKSGREEALQKFSPEALTSQLTGLYKSLL